MAESPHGLSILVESIQDIIKGESIDVLLSKSRRFREALSATFLDTKFIATELLRKAYLKEIYAVTSLLREVLSNKHLINSNLLLDIIVGLYVVDEDSKCILVKAKTLLPLVGESLVRQGGITCLELNRALSLIAGSIVKPVSTGLEDFLSDKG